LYPALSPGLNPGPNPGPSLNDTRALEVTSQGWTTVSDPYYLRAVGNRAIRLFVFNASVFLLAPIVVNMHTGACAQVILDDQDWPLQAELATRSA
jgi:hypothetical protein